MALNWIKYLTFSSSTSFNRILSSSSSAAAGTNPLLLTGTTCLKECQDCSEHEHPKIPDFLLKKISTEDMTNSVKSYHQHLFIQVPSNTNILSWPGHIEDWKPLSFLTADDFNKTQKKSNINLKVSLCSEFKHCVGYQHHHQQKEHEEQTINLDQVDTVDIWMYPGGKLMKNVGLSDLKSAVEKLLSVTSLKNECEDRKSGNHDDNYNNREKEEDNKVENTNSDKNGILSNKDVLTSQMNHSVIMVCAHTRRDKRCGVAGKLILEEMVKQIHGLNLQDKVKCFATSHLGGHKFAGTMIIYPLGVWYGRVKPCHVHQLVQETAIEGKIIPELFRGHVGTNQLSLTW